MLASGGVDPAVTARLHSLGRGGTSSSFLIHSVNLGVPVRKIMEQMARERYSCHVRNSVEPRAKAGDVFHVSIARAMAREAVLAF